MDFNKYFGECQVVPSLEYTDNMMCTDCKLCFGGKCKRVNPKWVPPDNFHTICKDFVKMFPQHRYNSFKENYLQYCAEHNVHLDDVYPFTKLGDNTNTYYVKMKDFVLGTLFDENGELKYVAKGYYVPYVSKFNRLDGTTERHKLSRWFVEIYEECEETLRLRHQYKHKVIMGGNK